MFQCKSRGLLAYNFAKSPFSAANAPLARARRIQGDVEGFGVEDIVDCEGVCSRACDKVWIEIDLIMLDLRCICTDRSWVLKGGRWMPRLIR